MNQRFALLFLCAAFGIAAYLVLDEWQYEKLSSINKMQQLWEQDLQLMEEQHQLPAGWSSIREIELNPGSAEALDWLKKLQVPVVVEKSGQYKLQILFFPWIEEGKQGVYLQYDLVDLKSKNSNTVFETSRTIMITGERNWLQQLLEQFQTPTPHPKPTVAPPPKAK